MGHSTATATAHEPTLTTVASLTRRDAAVVQIKRAILGGALRPGEKLTGPRLASQLGVSWYTVREGLNQLAQDGLLIQEPNRAMRVATLAPTEIAAIVQARVAIDVHAAEEILADSTGRRLTLLREGWTRYQQLAFDPGLVARHEAHLAFHRSVWEASENVLLLKMWPAAEAHIIIAIAQEQTPPDPNRAYDIHAKLVTAIQTRDMPAIKAALANPSLPCGSSQC
jgi:DNA-binding GntR family transcriptional regulator